eukprot:12030056-Alexandrium_andersonii.AAC.1
MCIRDSLRRALGGPSGARPDLAVELVALEHLLGLLGDAPAQARVVLVGEPVQVLPGGLDGPGGHDLDAA